MDGVLCVEGLGCHDFNSFKDSGKLRYLNNLNCCSFAIFIESLIAAPGAIIEIILCFQKIYFNLTFLHI